MWIKTSSEKIVNSNNVSYIYTEEGAWGNDIFLVTTNSEKIEYKRYTTTSEMEQGLKELLTKTGGIV